MNIICLVEDRTERKDLIAEHGLSFYIETDKHKILFDMGMTDAFIKNASCLGIDLSKVDIAFISHGHYDHGGGLEHFLKINDIAKVYISKYAFGQYYNGTEKYIGLDKSLKDNPRLVYVENTMSETFRIDNELEMLIPKKEGLRYAIDSYGLNIKLDNAVGVLQSDEFDHELYIKIKENDKEILISGCSHRGILNIMDKYNPDMLIGGFHFIKIDTKDEGLDKLHKAAEELNKYKCLYYTGHCTGEEQYKVLKNIMGDSIREFYAGSNIVYN